MGYILIVKRNRDYIMTLRKITQAKFTEILRLHKSWLRNDPLGIKADLRYFDLRGANLRGANLQAVNFLCSDLQDVDFWWANLRSADLQDTNLQYASLQDTDLRGAQFDQMIPHNCSIMSSKWLRSDIPWWLGHPDQSEIILCDE